MGEGEEVRITGIRRGDLADPAILKQIYQGRQTYYWTDDWSPEMYLALAKAGFISTTVDIGGPIDQLLLLPEIQAAYAVLDWGNLHASRSMRRWMKSGEFARHDFRIEVGYDLLEIADRIRRAHPDNWLKGRYLSLLKELRGPRWDGFELMPVALLTGEGELVAGEIGYRTGAIYTSLSGFFDRENQQFNHAGKLQLHLLAAYLCENGFAFWNLGHPYMPYKTELGARITPRAEFLDRWKEAVGIEMPGFRKSGHRGDFRGPE
jgi:Leu/Phe-tRNA-protein transferase